MALSDIQRDKIKQFEKREKYLQGKVPRFIFKKDNLKMSKPKG
jgi:hypothetical protein